MGILEILGEEYKKRKEARQRIEYLEGVRDNLKERWTEAQAEIEKLQRQISRMIYQNHSEKKKLLDFWRHLKICPHCCIYPRAYCPKGKKLKRKASEIVGEEI